jgi:hypothetical protein
MGNLISEVSKVIKDLYPGDPSLAKPTEKLQANLRSDKQLFNDFEKQLKQVENSPKGSKQERNLLASLLGQTAGELPELLPELETVAMLL